MNRKIKFRAFARAEKKIYTVSKIDFEFQSLFLLGKNGSFGGFLFSEVELMQFTGLYDKNGKEIYEGDILTIFKDEKEISEVFYKKGCFCIRLNSIDYYLSTYGRFNLKIIGNIHENPELLEK